MTEAEKILRDMITLRESVEANRADLANLPMSAETRNGILVHTGWCLEAFHELKARLEARSE